MENIKLPKDIKTIIEDFLYGDIEFGEIISNIDNMDYKKHQRINKIFNLNEKIYKKQKNHVNHINDLRLYKRLLSKFVNPLQNGMPIDDLENELLLLINNPYDIVPFSFLF